MLPRIRRSILFGAGVGALFFVCDLTGAMFAISTLFDPKPQSALLLAAAAVVEMGFGALLGALVFAAFPRVAAWHPRRGRILAGCVGLGLAVTVVGYASRLGRRPAELPPRPPVTAERPADILWIVVDTLRADALYGSQLDFPLAPDVGAWARNALVFTDAESAAGWTIPSMATMLTGVHPEPVDATERPLSDRVRTAAEHFRAAGYTTHAVVDNSLIERRTGFGAGFETFSQRSAFRFAFSLPGFRVLPQSVQELFREAAPVVESGALALTDTALAVLSAPRQAPLFLFVHYMDPHDPYYPHPEQNGALSDTSLLRVKTACAKVREDPSAAPAPEALSRMRHRYEGEVRYLNASLGRLLSAWQARIGSNGVAVLTADHGEEFLDHGELCHGQSLYHELVHVPLLLKLPASLLPQEKAQGVVSHPVGLVDVLPTLLDAVGARPLSTSGSMPIQGVSWLPWLRGDASPSSRPLYSAQWHYGRRIMRWREGPWALVATRYYPTLVEKAELFDKAADYAERTNAAATNTALAQAMQSRLASFEAGHAEAPAARPSGEAPDPTTLRSLGYIQ